MLCVKTPISKGEEILLDYGKGYWRHHEMLQADQWPLLVPVPPAHGGPRPLPHSPGPAAVPSAAVRADSPWEARSPRLANCGAEDRPASSAGTGRSACAVRVRGPGGEVACGPHPRATGDAPSGGCAGPYRDCPRPAGRKSAGHAFVSYNVWCGVTTATQRGVHRFVPMRNVHLRGVGGDRVGAFAKTSIAAGEVIGVYAGTIRRCVSTHRCSPDLALL